MNARESLAHVARGIHASEEAARQERLASDTVARDRRILATEGSEEIRRLFQALKEQVVSSIGRAPEARASESVTLGRGSISMELPFPLIDAAAFARSRRNVLAGGLVAVRQTGTSYVGRSANVWFGQLGTRGELGLWESAYMESPLLRATTRRVSPFGIELENQLDIADRAASTAMETFQYGYGPVLVQGEARDRFFERWISFLAKAAEGQLDFPRVLPTSE